MEKYPFIFSDRWEYRLKRHLIFWGCWWLFSGFLYSYAGGIINFAFLRRLSVSFIESFAFLVPHIFLAYSLMYFVVPKLLLKAKYANTIAAVVILFFLTGCISAVISIYLLHPLRILLFNTANLPRFTYEFGFHMGLMAGLRGGITIGGIATAIKLMKYWYGKEQRNLQLQKENIASQLQVLKAQVHPHFLFNTLNNIYSGTQVTSPKAAEMIAGLSELLRYMLYECNQPLVSLSRELKMLEQYILLEKNRYGNNLDINLKLPEHTNKLLVAPLILLPFVENCFKHGTSKMLEQPWISLYISIEGEWLKMKLLNGKINEENPVSPGIGLTNVIKRLELLYPQKHELLINNEEEVYIVNLKLALEKKNLNRY